MALVLSGRMCIIINTCIYLHSKNKMLLVPTYIEKFLVNSIILYFAEK